MSAQDETDDLARLDDYVRGHTPDAEAGAFEEDLFARAAFGAAPELTLRAGMVSALRALERSGALQLWVTERELERLLASGKRVVRFDFDPAHPSLPSFTTDFEVLVTRVPVALEGVKRLDAEILTPGGDVVKVMPDIAFALEDGAIFACCDRELAIRAANAKMTTRIWAITDGDRRLLLEIPATFGETPLRL